MKEDLRWCNPHWVCGKKFLKWGLGFFLLGILMGFGVLIHYLVGSRWNVTPGFLSNVTLWFGSPLSLNAAYLQIGGVAMAIIGACECGFSRVCCDTSMKTTSAAACPTTYHAHGGGVALALCIIGLIALFLTGYIGYFIINGIWPAFYYTPIAAGKNLWLVLQGISLLIYFIGMISAFCCLCKCCRKEIICT